MANNIFEQLNEAYSRWSILDTVGQEMQLVGMWNQLRGAYNYICQLYQNRGYLTSDEANYANQISQMLAVVQNEKRKVDQNLASSMIKHLVKMKAEMP